MIREAHHYTSIAAIGTLRPPYDVRRGSEPDVMSLKPAALEYISRLRKPSDDFPLEIKKSFRREMTLAAVCHA